MPGGTWFPVASVASSLMPATPRSLQPAVTPAGCDVGHRHAARGWDAPAADQGFAGAAGAGEGSIRCRSIVIGTFDGAATVRRRVSGLYPALSTVSSAGRATTNASDAVPVELV